MKILHTTRQQGIALVAALVVLVLGPVIAAGIIAVAQNSEEEPVTQTEQSVATDETSNGTEKPTDTPSSLQNANVDTHNRSAVAKLLGSVSQYISNNNGVPPSSVESFPEEIEIPLTVDDTAFTVVSSVPQQNEIQYVVRGVCQDNGTAEPVGSSRISAAVVMLTNGTFACYEI